jgi:hypothetical protein
MQESRETGHNYRAGEGTNGGPSESDRKPEGRSVNKNTSVASRIVFLGANAQFNKNLRQSAVTSLSLFISDKHCHRHTIPRVVMVDVTGTIFSAQHNECLATAGTAGTEFQATRPQRPELS